MKKAIPPGTDKLYAQALREFARLFEKAKKSASIRDATAMVLATADCSGRPSIRAVLLKGADSRGFVFYTNKESRKGRKMLENPQAALTFLWHPIGQQVHIEGRVEQVSDSEADAYWETRQRDSQLGAWASLQSRPMASRWVLLRRVSEYAGRFRGKPVPRPAAWTGFRVEPDRIEFWKEGAFRLHHRVLYERRGNKWSRLYLYP